MSIRTRSTAIASRTATSRVVSRGLWLSVGTVRSPLDVPLGLLSVLSLLGKSKQTPEEIPLFDIGGDPLPQFGDRRQSGDQIVVSLACGHKKILRAKPKWFYPEDGGQSLRDCAKITFTSMSTEARVCSSSRRGIHVVSISSEQVVRR